jgi:hypothetical protein
MRRFTEFYDVSTGGFRKTQYRSILIELPKQKAIQYFTQRFKLDPYNYSCKCCGTDFEIDVFMYGKKAIRSLKGQESILVIELTAITNE